MTGIVFNPVNPNELPSVPAGAMILFFTADGKLMAKDGAGALRQVTSSVGSSYLWNFNTEDFPTIPVIDYGNRNMVEFVANKCVEGVHQFSVIDFRKWYDDNGGYEFNPEFAGVQQFGSGTKTIVHINKHRVVAEQFSEYNVVTMQEYPSAYNMSNNTGYPSSYYQLQRFHKIFIMENENIEIPDTQQGMFLVGGETKKVQMLINYMAPQFEI